jgi:hypothetical protein
MEESIMASKSKKTVYRRRFSELEPWQAAGTAFYDVLLPARDGEGFGVGIRFESGERTQSAQYEALFSTRRQADRLACFLCENAVTPAQLEGVVRDLVAPAAQAYC